MVKLSIVVTTYNHEKYIEQTINGILKQKVNFEFEVLIGEDCSTDRTREVLKNLEKQLPQNFKMFYREKNYGPIDNAYDLYRRMQGEYFTMVEGDDFWIDEYKLQRQVDFLDSSSEYIGCAHNVQVVDAESNPINETYPECKEEEYSLKHFELGILPGQTCSCVYRNILLSNQYDSGLFFERRLVGDRKIAFIMASQGKIRVFQKKWSAYRHVIDSGESYSAQRKKMKGINVLSELEYLRKMIEFSFRVDNKEAIIISKTMMIKELLKETRFLLALRMLLEDEDRNVLFRRIITVIKYKHFHCFRKEKYLIQAR